MGLRLGLRVGVGVRAKVRAKVGVGVRVGLVVKRSSPYQDGLDGHDGELVHILLAGVEEVEGEVVALEDGAELVLLPVLVGHHHAVRVARPLVPHLKGDVHRPARVVRALGRGQLLVQQQLGAALGLLGGDAT